MKSSLKFLIVFFIIYDWNNIWTYLLNLNLLSKQKDMKNNKLELYIILIKIIDARIETAIHF